MIMDPIYPPRTRQQVWEESGGTGPAPEDCDLESQGLSPISLYPNLVEPVVVESKASQLARLSACIVAATTAIKTAKEAQKEARRNAADWIKANPPTSFRLQEAYQNADGTFSAPHWDEVLPYATHNAVDQEEVNFYLLFLGKWFEVFHNPDDDPRPGYRRIAEVTW